MGSRLRMRGRPASGSPGTPRSYHTSGCCQRPRAAVSCAPMAETPGAATSGAEPMKGNEPAAEEVAARAAARALDVGLIDRALAGEGQAFEALFEKYREKVYRV